MKYQRECKFCGKPFETDNSKKVFCRWECTREFGKIRAREYYREYSKQYKYTKRCQHCGKLFQAGRNKLYCSKECKSAALTKTQVPKKKRQVMSLSQVARAAREVGMSYGEYVRKMEAG